LRYLYLKQQLCLPIAMRRNSSVFLSLMKYEILTQKDFQDWLAMAADLWPGESSEALERLFGDLLSKKNYQTYIARTEQSEPVGFIYLSIRNDYVEGSDSSPVGYVEGIYVKPEYRKKGVARAMLQIGERWSKENGCQEYASDTELKNVDSQNFHVRAGFEIAETIVHFIKRIN
jgi:aminoglycoside 6'-N-acetyltransferase I